MNRTIYVKDAQLWERAKVLAAKQGRSISEVIADALARYCAEPLRTSYYPE